MQSKPKAQQYTEKPLRSEDLFLENTGHQSTTKRATTKLRDRENSEPELRS